MSPSFSFAFFLQTQSPRSCGAPHDHGFAQSEDQASRILMANGWRPTSVCRLSTASRDHRRSELRITLRPGVSDISSATPSLIPRNRLAKCQRAGSRCVEAMSPYTERLVTLVVDEIPIDAAVVLIWSISPARRRFNALEL